MKYFELFLCLIILSFPQQAAGQYYNTGQDPSSLRWIQTETERFRVIYPEDYSEKGVEFARSLEESYMQFAGLYPERKFKIPVIIHNHSIMSNGYVTWAPKRMEIYPTPEQNSIPLDPVKQLSIHEMTHVYQMTSLNQGISKVMSAVLGEQFTGLVAALLPLWFFEGQAVLAETALSPSGRGRSPAFLKQLKAISLERGEMYKYDKLLNGSYRDYVPDQYHTGYQIVTWAMVRHDPSVWNKVIDYTARRPFTINPVNFSLKDNTGLRKKTLAKETFSELQDIWKKETDRNKAESYPMVNPGKKGEFINYLSPVYAGKDSIVAVRTSLSEPPEIVLINPGKAAEKKLHVPGPLYPYFISAANGKATWVETRPDPRWENRKYSEIFIHDILKGKTRKITGRSRYVAVSLSHNGNRLAAIESSPENITSLVILDAKHGTIQQTAVLKNSYLQRPAWSEDDRKVTVIYLTEDGEGIAEYDFSGSEWKILINPGREDLQASYVRNDSLYFISSFSGTDNVYLKTPGNEIFRLTNTRSGTSDFSVSGKNLIFTDYTMMGNNVCVVPLKPVRLSTSTTDSTSFLISRLNRTEPVKSEKTDIIFSQEPYRKWKHLFNFHSWMPFYADIEEVKADPASVRPGLTLLSQNQLSTLTSSVGYEYSEANRHLLHTRITWEGWYPVVEARFDYGYEPVVSGTGESTEKPPAKPGYSFSGTVSQPLNFSTGKFSQYLRPSITTTYRNNIIPLNDGDFYDSGQAVFTGRLFFSNMYRYSLRDIYPKWGQVLDLNYSYAPFDKKIYGSVTTLKTTFFLPGLFADNGIRIRYEKEKQDPSQYIFGNRAHLPRGYKDIISMRIDFVSADYVMPLAYPDFNLAGLLYLKRLRGGLFYDYARCTDNTFYIRRPEGLVPLYRNPSTQAFRSYGMELFADLHLFRIPYMISGGVQGAWKDISEKPYISFLFNIDIYGIAVGKKQF